MPTTHLRRAAHRRALFAAPEGREAARSAPGVSGMVLDASPHLLVVAEAGARGAETRIAMSEDTAIWHGGRGAPPRCGRAGPWWSGGPAAAAPTGSGWASAGSAGRSSRAGAAPWRWTWGRTAGAPTW